MAALAELVGEGGAHWVLRPAPCSPPPTVVRVAKRPEERRREYVSTVQRHIDRVVASVLGRHFVDAGCVVPAPFRAGFFAGEEHAWGLEVRDWMRMTLPRAPRAVLTVEVKPKSGLGCAGRSKLVPAEHAVKFTQTRFAMKQAHKMAEGLISAQSRYDPCQLFARDSTQVAVALEALLLHPQNNLRVFLDGRPVPLTSPALDDALAAAFGDVCGERDVRAAAVEGVPGAGTPAREWLVETLAQILVEEPVLERVLALQRRDVVDVEGAHLLWGRLVAALGSSAAVEAELAQALTAPVPAPTPHLVDKLAWSWRGDGAIPSPQQQEVAASCVALLEHRETVNLLANWLLALAAADCSVMIALAQLDRPLPSRRLQAASSPGTLPCGVAYEMGLTDVGPKPPYKAAFKFQQETEFCACAARAAVAVQPPAQNAQLRMTETPTSNTTQACISD